MSEQPTDTAKPGSGGWALPFVVALAASLLLFLALDYAVMSLQGLSLIFEP